MSLPELRNNGNNQGAVYFWKTQIFKEADKEQERENIEVWGSREEGSGLVPRERCSLQGEGNGNSAEFVGTQIRARILLQ